MDKPLEISLVNFYTHNGGLILSGFMSGDFERTWFMTRPREFMDANIEEDLPSLVKKIKSVRDGRNFYSNFNGYETYISNNHNPSTEKIVAERTGLSREQYHEFSMHLAKE